MYIYKIPIDGIDILLDDLAGEKVDMCPIVCEKPVDYHVHVTCDVLDLYPKCVVTKAITN